LHNIATEEDQEDEEEKEEENVVAVIVVVGNRLRELAKTSCLELL